MSRACVEGGIQGARGRPTVLVAGASGYLGRHLVAEERARGWRLRALVRSTEAARRAGLDPGDVRLAPATDPARLGGVMDGVDLVVSALGITRQRDGLSYVAVDFRANANLLDEALAAGVPRFAYVHVLNAGDMAGVPRVDAKQASPVAKIVVTAAARTNAAAYDCRVTGATETVTGFDRVAMVKEGFEHMRAMFELANGGEKVPAFTMLDARV